MWPILCVTSRMSGWAVMGQVNAGSAFLLLMHRTESSFLLATNGSCLSMQSMGICHEICLTAAAGVALWSAPGHHPEAE